MHCPRHSTKTIKTLLAVRDFVPRPLMPLCHVDAQDASWPRHATTPSRLRLRTAKRKNMKNNGFRTLVERKPLFFCNHESTRMDTNLSPSATSNASGILFTPRTTVTPRRRSLVGSSPWLMLKNHVEPMFFLVFFNGVERTQMLRLRCAPLSMTPQQKSTNRLILSPLKSPSGDLGVKT